jgi:hypothetical protein
MCGSQLISLQNLRPVFRVQITVRQLRQMVSLKYTRLLFRTPLVPKSAFCLVWKMVLNFQKPCEPNGYLKNIYSFFWAPRLRQGNH